MEEGGDTTDPQCSITISVKFSGRSIPITLPPDSTVKHLKSLLQPLTNVLPRGQKLISKGKLLVDDMTLRSSEDGPIKKEAPRVSNLRRMAEDRREKKEKPDIAVEKSQLERWKATGVVALSACDLKVIPQEVWTCGPSARVLDLSHNSIQHVPAAVGSLSSLQKLFLNANDVPDESICWEAVSSLKSLTVLSLSQNYLTNLPSTIGALTCLTQLHLTNNKLTCLPTEIGLLSNLQILKANNNRISTIPTCIGCCTSLVEVDLSSNLLLELPDEFSSLRNLKALHLDNNGLKTLPATLLKMCIQLSTLDLHGTEITMDLLRQFEGWESFDKRRRLKHQKQLAFRVEGSAAFDEGADKN
ncbi:hypothetical protein RJ640_025140 [Escallonia rubra]|uniref:Ubiquitin-like domain-containing protein n=1 Tax=Escallonia rubra TaxID=112253 RepID=A0AA88UFA2_9ASTE|nr:hypothetical protein RJ640_025140 [Escallonia rubra]